MKDQDTKVAPTGGDGEERAELGPTTGALIIERPRVPGRFSFTLLVPCETTWTVKDFGSAQQLDFRPRTPAEMAELWREKGRL